MNTCIEKTLETHLLSNGASKVGFSDISILPEQSRRFLKSAVTILVALDAAIISGIAAGPTIEYYNEYKRVNSLLDELAYKTANLLKSEGYTAIALATTDTDIDMNTLSTVFPHKTAATRAGLGWIGKSALLVTREYGCAVRITTVLTNADFEESTPVNMSFCGSCTDCVRACPGGAIKGPNWDIGKEREHIYDAFVCREAARAQARNIGINNTICGICIASCPWTKKYIRNILSV